MNRRAFVRALASILSALAAPLRLLGLAETPTPVEVTEDVAWPIDQVGRLVRIYYSGGGEWVMEYIPVDEIVRPDDFCFDLVDAGEGWVVGEVREIKLLDDTGGDE